MSEPRHLFDRLLADSNSDTSPAFIFLFGDQRSTYSRSELHDAVVSLGEKIKSTECTDGIVAVLASSQEQQVLHYLACLYADLCPAILTPPTPKMDRQWYLKNLAGVLREIEPTLVVTDLAEELIAAAGSAEGLPTVVALGANDKPVLGSQEVRQIDTKTTAFVQFSSGTTGVKKGVQVSSKAAFAQIDSYANALKISTNDCIVNWLPLYHDMGFFTSIHLSLATKTPAVLLDPIEWVTKPEIYLKAMQEFSGTLSWHPNFAYNFMSKRVRAADAEGLDLSSVRLLVNCSEPVTFDSQAAFADRFVDYGLAGDVFAGCYAMAETTFAVTHGTDSQHNSIDHEGPIGAHASLRRPVVSVGRVLDGAQVAIRDENNTDVAERTMGEIWIKASFLGDRYIDDAATAESFVDGWYRTGDLGYLADGNLYVTGRKKDVLIVAGHNVFPDDIEAVVGLVAGFKPGRVAAFAEFDERLQTERVVVLAEPAVDEEPDVMGAMSNLTTALQLSNMSIEIVPIGWLVKSSSGKIARRASADKWHHEQENS